MELEQLSKKQASRDDGALLRRGTLPITPSFDVRAENSNATNWMPATCLRRGGDGDGGATALRRRAAALRAEAVGGSAAAE